MILAGFSSLSGGYPCFVIPVFSSFNSNLTYVQDLTLDRKIDSFKIIMPSDFFTVPAIPPAITRSEGDEGIYAFWLSATQVLVGTHKELVAEIVTIEEANLPAFVATEAMTMIGDEERLKAASGRAAQMLLNPVQSDAFQTEMINRLRYITRIVESQPDNVVDKQEESLAQFIAMLQAELTDARWSDIWGQAWEKFNASDKLVDILRWKIEGGLRIYEQQSCVLKIIFNGTSRQRDFVFNWLGKNGFGAPSWPAIWLNLLRWGNYDIRQFLELGIRLLEDSTKRTDFSIEHQWCVVWSRLWRERFDLERLRDIAIEACIRHRIANMDSFVRLVINPALRVFDDDEALNKYILTWLKRPVSLRVWVTTYIDSDSKFGSDEEYRMAGWRWLEIYGAGMLVWLPLWRHLQSRDGVAKVDLAYKWLLRSRKDLSNWPDVFQAALDLTDGKPNAELRAAANLWIGENYSQKRGSVLIKSVADGSFDGR